MDIKINSLINISKDGTSMSETRRENDPIWRQQVFLLYQNYLKQGFSCAGELILPIEQAKLALEDLEALQVPTPGTDGWFYLSEPARIIAQKVGVYFSVPKNILVGPDNVENSHRLMRNFIEYKVPTFGDYVQLLSLDALLPKGLDDEITKFLRDNTTSPYRSD